MGHYKEITDMEQVDLLQQAGLLYYKHHWNSKWYISKPPGDYGGYDIWILWSKWIVDKGSRPEIRFAVYVEEDESTQCDHIEEDE